MSTAASAGWPWKAEYDDGTFVCPDCGESMSEALAAVESYERFDTILCDLCAEARCEQEEDDDVR